MAAFTQSCFSVTEINMYPYIELFGRTVPSYGVCLLFAIVTVFLLSLRSALKYGYGIYDLLLVGAPALLLGLPAGSLLYTLVTYDLNEIIGFIAAGDFRPFGGLVFYGSVVVGFFGGLIGIRLTRLDIAIVERCVVPFIPIGHAIGRVGCLLAGCCYGIEYEGFGAVRYPACAVGVTLDQGYFPVQLLEAMFNIITCFILLKLRKKAKSKFELTALYFLLYGTVRFFVEFLRGDKIRGELLELSTSQWISVVLTLAGALFLLFLSVRQRSKEET